MIGYLPVRASRIIVLRSVDFGQTGDYRKSRIN